MRVLGIIENMSHYQCPSCGHREEIFGAGGVEKASQEMNMEMLGKVQPVCFLYAFLCLLVVQFLFTLLEMGT